MNPQLEVVIIHDGTVILEVNTAFCDLFRCDCETFVNRRVEQIIYSDELRTLAVWRGKHIMAIGKDKEFEQQYDFERCDGTRFWGRAISRRIEDGKYKTIVRWEYDIDR
jgi:PAS domain S-box-containing protein